MNTPQYVHMMTWLQALTVLIEQMQVRRPLQTFHLIFLYPSFLTFLSLISMGFLLTGAPGSSNPSCR